MDEEEKTLVIQTPPTSPLIHCIYCHDKKVIWDKILHLATREMVDAYVPCPICQYKGIARKGDESC